MRHTINMDINDCHMNQKVDLCELKGAPNDWTTSA